MSTAVRESMAVPLGALPGDWSLADLQIHLGGVSLERIRLFPPPGYATEEDVESIEAHEGRLFELEDGILVEKTVGWYESLLAVLIGTELSLYLAQHDLGKVLGADGALRILPGIVKIPDVSFISWNRWPKEKLPRGGIPALIPDLVIEVLSKSNAPAEMDTKLDRYFHSGVRLVWYIDPGTQTAKAYSSPSDVATVGVDDVLDGGDVLPGFQLSLRKLFEEADRQAPETAE